MRKAETVLALQLMSISTVFLLFALASKANDCCPANACVATILGTFALSYQLPNLHLHSNTKDIL